MENPVILQKKIMEIFCRNVIAFGMQLRYKSYVVVCILCLKQVQKVRPLKYQHILYILYGLFSKALHEIPRSEPLIETNSLCCEYA